jgi:hypothetical protein
MHGRWFAVFVSAALSAAACGKAVESGGASAADAGGGGDDDGSDGADDATEPDAGDDGSEPDAAQPSTTRGLIRIFSANYVEGGGSVQNASVEALFGDFETESCGLELADGACSVLSCTDRVPSAAPPDAGVIDVFVEAEVVAKLEPAEDGTYARYERIDDELFDIGPSLRATAVGADVPAFEVTGTAPAGIAFDGGVPTSAGAIDVSVGGAYGVRWAPGADSERIRVRMTSIAGEGVQRLVLSCSAPASTGDLVVPPALLGLLPLGVHQFEARVVTEQTVQAGDFGVTLSAERPALDLPSGNWARGTVNLVP